MASFRRGIWLVLLPVAVYAAIILAHGYDVLPALFEDDAHYYFVTAENLLRTGTSTFDGVTTTTGYHPLWFALNLALIGICGSVRPIYMRAVVVMCALLAVAHGGLLRRLFGKLSPSTTLADIATILVLLRSLDLAFDGMECALAMPLLAWCAFETLTSLEASAPTARRMMTLGFLASAVALARIDALIFGLMCGGVVLLYHHRTVVQTIRRAADFGVGLVPFFAYLACNWLTSGSALTTSARAKTLAGGLMWNWRIFDNLSRGHRFGFLYLPITASLLLCTRWSPWSKIPRLLALAIFGFPVVYYLTIALRSGWQIWSWYLYPLPLCMGVAIVALGDAVRTRWGVDERYYRTVSRWAVPAAVLASLVLIVRVWFAPPTYLGRLRAASAIAEFSRTHPGRYAMGDRAGLAAFVVPRPFVQLEGLVADEAMLDAIRAQQSLRVTLSVFGIDYLVEALPTGSVAAGSCQKIDEPKVRQAGERSPKMRGTFCDPLLRYDDPSDSYTTLVFAANAPGEAR